MQSLLHPELTRILAADAAQRGPRIARNPHARRTPRIRPRWTLRIRHVTTKSA